LDIEGVLNGIEIGSRETMFPDPTTTFWTTNRNWPGIVFPLLGKLINLTRKKAALFFKKFV